MTVRPRLMVVAWLVALCACGGPAAQPVREAHAVGGDPSPAAASATTAATTTRIDESDAGALREAVAGLSTVGDDVRRLRASLDGFDRQASDLRDLLGRAARGLAADAAAGGGALEERSRRLVTLRQRFEAVQDERTLVAAELSVIDGHVRSVIDYVQDAPSGRAEDVNWVRRRSERHGGELRALDGRIDRVHRDLGLLALDVDALGIPTEPAPTSSTAVAGGSAAGAPAAGASSTGALPVAAAATTASEAPRPSADVLELVTSVGVLLVELYDDVAPRNVASVRQLVGSGFYDGLSFHRIIPDYLVQGGCPLGTGAGGAGREVRAEFSALPHRRGTVSMARMSHPDTASSQFFICLRRIPDLDAKYTVIGQVIRGDKVLDALAAQGTPSGRPVEPVPRIEKATLRPRRPDDAGPIADARGR